eukprot:TCONS_00049382-protein
MFKILQIVCCLFHKFSSSGSLSGSVNNDSTINDVSVSTTFGSNEFSIEFSKVPFKLSRQLVDVSVNVFKDSIPKDSSKLSKFIVLTIAEEFSSPKIFLRLDKGEDGITPPKNFPRFEKGVDAIILKAFLYYNYFCTLKDFQSKSFFYWLEKLI